MYVKFQDFSREKDPEQWQFIDASIERVLDSGKFILDKEVRMFEEEFAEYIGVKHCIAVGNGFDALRIAQMALLRKDSQVLVPSKAPLFSFMSVDASGNTPCVLEPYANAIADATMVVYLYGTMIESPLSIPLMMNAGFGRHYLIEDCAQAHGMLINGRKAGTFGDVSCFSFYPTKNLGCLGDGGAILTNYSDVADDCRKIRIYGQGELLGANSRMDELQAAILRDKLPFLDRKNSVRSQIARKYMRNLPEKMHPTVSPNVTPIWHQFVINHPNRDKLKVHLTANGIQTMIYYPKQTASLPYYRYTLGGKLLETQEFFDNSLALPVHPFLTDKEVLYVCEKIMEFEEREQKTGN